MNQQPSLRQFTSTSEAGMKADNGQTEKQNKRNQSEKARRGLERSHIERISRLFKAPGRAWSKKDALGLGEMVFFIDE